MSLFSPFLLTHSPSALTSFVSEYNEIRVFNSVQMPASEKKIWLSLVLSFVHRFLNTSLDSETGSNHVMGTMKESEQGNAETKEQWTEQDVTNALISVKIVTRTGEDLDVLWEMENVSMLFRVAVNKVGSAANEAAMAIVLNMYYLKRMVMTECVQVQGFFPKFIQAIQKVEFSSLTPMMHHIMARLTMLLTLKVSWKNDTAFLLDLAKFLINWFVYLKNLNVYDSISAVAISSLVQSMWNISMQDEGKRLIQIMKSDSAEKLFLNLLEILALDAPLNIETGVPAVRPPDSNFLYAVKGDIVNLLFYLPSVFF